MDVVIPYRNSASNGLELRYTLRGIEKYFPGLENVFIIGDCPGFIQNVIHIPATDLPERHFKARNIMNKLLVACYDKRVSDSFAMFNDEHFLLMPWKPAFYFSGLLEQSIAKFNSHQTYRQTLVNTMGRLDGGLDYDTHFPIVYQKELFIRTMQLVDWSRPWGYGIKSLYCNLGGITGEYHADLKIKQACSVRVLEDVVHDHPCFSIDDRALNESMEYFLLKLYPQKSIYESD